MLETTERERWRSAVLTLRTTETADFQRRERESERERGVVAVGGLGGLGGPAKLAELVTPKLRRHS